MSESQSYNLPEKIRVFSKPGKVALALLLPWLENTYAETHLFYFSLSIPLDRILVALFKGASYFKNSNQFLLEELSKSEHSCCSFNYLSQHFFIV